MESGDGRKEREKEREENGSPLLMPAPALLSMPPLSREVSLMATVPEEQPMDSTATATPIESRRSAAKSDEPTATTASESASSVPPLTNVANRPMHYPPPSSSSRASSTRTSSSSLHTLSEEASSPEDSITQPPRPHLPPSMWSQTSTQTILGPTPRHPDRFNSTMRPNLPVYPDQTYAALTYQHHPVYHPAHRPRSTHLPQQSQVSDPRLRDRASPTQVSKTAGNTPVSSPGLFSSRSSRTTPSVGQDEDLTPHSPYLHPTQMLPPKETHTAEVDRDIMTGNKLINDYEVLEELGRGEHGKVKLGRDLSNGQQVAIKIVQRYSKRRRLGRLGNPEEGVKKEVAILKKARHPNVVALLEVIDDPNRQKVYIVLEFVEKGEIVWREKGLREVVMVEKQRWERERRGVHETQASIDEDYRLFTRLQHQRQERERLNLRREPVPAWSLEHGGDSDDESSPSLSRSRTDSRSNSSFAVGSPTAFSPPGHTSVSIDELERRAMETASLEGSMYGAYAGDPIDRNYSFSSSFVSHLSSEIDWNSDDEETSYVPTLTLSEARNAFRDSVLGLEYLHYQGIIHRDIKPANLLVAGNNMIKISDFGVSYLGRPLREDEDEHIGEMDATQLDDARELSKTVGTPAFYAPELCYVDHEFEERIGKVPKITGAIDVWSLGVTLYGMIYGRLPFTAGDEYGLFTRIVNDEAFIPRKRLRAVEEQTGSRSSSYAHIQRTMNSNKRLPHELAYEEVNDELHDLLRRLLQKDPSQRITLKEIKHHPWVLSDIMDQNAWIQDTDPGNQSKGKKIEVTNDEVTSAVTKVPFVERIRSGMQRLGLFGRSKDSSRKRAPSAAGTPDGAYLPSTSGAFNSHVGQVARDKFDLRRLSLKSDDEMARVLKASRESDHPLAHSVTVTPDELKQDSSYFTTTLTKVPSHSHSMSAGATPRAIPDSERQSRPSHFERAHSVLSTSDSNKTVTGRGIVQPRSVASSIDRDSSSTPAVINAVVNSSLSGFLGQATRRLARSARGSDKGGSSRSSSVDRSSIIEEDRHTEPSLALSTPSISGLVLTPDCLRDDVELERGLASQDTARYAPSHSRQSSRPAHEESYQQAREQNFRRLKLETEIARSRASSRNEGTVGDCPPSPDDSMQTQQRVDWGLAGSPMLHQGGSGLPVSPPSAETVSSSSVDDYQSNMSQSTSYPSIPSVISGASSLSGDGFYTHTKDHDAEVPPMMRTGDTVTARSKIGPMLGSLASPSSSDHLDDDDYFARQDSDQGLRTSHYYYGSDAEMDHGDDDDDDDSEDEGIVFGKKKPDVKKGSTQSSQQS